MAQPPNLIPLGVANDDFERHLPKQSVGGASEAGIISSEWHLHHVQNALVNLPVLDEALCCLFNRHTHRSTVLAGRHDETHLLYDSFFIDPIVME